MAHRDNEEKSSILIEYCLLLESDGAQMNAERCVLTTENNKKNH